jgi:hypothetical protein
MNEVKLALATRKITDILNNADIFKSISFSQKFDYGASNFTVNSSPSREAVKAAAVDIRHFTANKSQLIMGGIIKELHKIEHIDSNKLDVFYNTWLQCLGERKGGALPLGVALNIDGIELTVKQQIDLWVNGEIFHTDLDKVDTLSKMEVVHFKSIAWLNFIAIIQNLSGLLVFFKYNFLDKVNVN